MMAATAVISLVAATLSADERGTPSPRSPSTAQRTAKVAELKKEAAKLEARAKAVERSRKKDAKTKADQLRKQAKELRKKVADIDVLQIKARAAKKRAEAKRLMYEARRIAQAKKGDWKKQVEDRNKKAEKLTAEAQNLDNKARKLLRQAAEPDAAIENSVEERDEEGPCVSSVLAVLKRMPRAFLPDPESGWNELTLPKVNEWLAKYSKKKPFRGKLALKSCSVRHIKGDTYSTSVIFRTVPDAKLTFRNQTIWLRLIADNLYLSRYGGIVGQLLPSNTRYEGPWQTTRNYSTSQAEAEKWKRKPKGKRFDIAGQMVSASLKPISRDGVEGAIDYLCLVRIRKFSITEHKARRAVPKKPQPTTKSAADKAAARVQLAKAYLSSGMKAKAMTILMEVVEKYPNTKAAAAAEELLKGIGKQGTQ